MIILSKMSKGKVKSKKCPVCSSTRLKINDLGDISCLKCGWVNSKEKNAQIIEY